jgi:hypothetical protein
MLGEGNDKGFRPWRWLGVSLAGFLFWSAVIAAGRMVGGLL